MNQRTRAPQPPSIVGGGKLPRALPASESIQATAIVEAVAGTIFLDQATAAKCPSHRPWLEKQHRTGSNGHENKGNAHVRVKTPCAESNYRSSRQSRVYQRYSIAFSQSDWILIFTLHTVLRASIRLAQRIQAQRATLRLIVCKKPNACRACSHNLVGSRSPSPE